MTGAFRRVLRVDADASYSPAGRGACLRAGFPGGEFEGGSFFGRKAGQRAATGARATTRIVRARPGSTHPLDTSMAFALPLRRLTAPSWVRPEALNVTPELLGAPLAPFGRR